MTRPKEATFVIEPSPNGLGAVVRAETTGLALADAPPPALRLNWRVLRAVQSGMTSAAAIALFLDVRTPVVSRELQLLKRAGLVRFSGGRWRARE